MLRGCELSRRSIADFLDFGQLVIITLISRWVHVPCITTIESEGGWGYLTRPTLQVVARGELIPLRI